MASEQKMCSRSWSELPCDGCSTLASAGLLARCLKWTDWILIVIWLHSFNEDVKDADNKNTTRDTEETYLRGGKWLAYDSLLREEGRRDVLEMNLYPCNCKSVHRNCAFRVMLSYVQLYIILISFSNIAKHLPGKKIEAPGSSSGFSLLPILCLTLNYWAVGSPLQDVALAF